MGLWKDLLGTWSTTFKIGAKTKQANLDTAALTVNRTHTLPDRAGTVALDPAVAAKTANYTLTGTDAWIKADASGGSFTLTLPTAVGISGRKYTITRTDNTPANTVTVATTSSQTISGAATMVIQYAFSSLDVVSDNSNWIIQ